MEIFILLPNNLTFGYFLYHYKKFYLLICKIINDKITVSKTSLFICITLVKCVLSDFYKNLVQSDKAYLQVLFWGAMSLLGDVVQFLKPFQILGLSVRLQQIALKTSI